MRDVLLAFLLVVPVVARSAPLPERPFTVAAVAGPVVVTRYDVYVEAVLAAAASGYRFEAIPNRALLLDALRARLTREAILDAARSRSDVLSTEADRERLRELLLRPYGGDVEAFSRQTGISGARFAAEIRDRTLAQAWIRTLAAAPAAAEAELERLDRVRKAIERVRARYFERHPAKILDADLRDALPFPELASD